MLILGAQKINGASKAETINTCVARQLNFFYCGHFEMLWNQAHQVVSRRPGAPRVLTSEDIDRLVQDAADKDNYLSAYARTVKAQKMAVTNGGNLVHVIDKYAKRAIRGYGQAAAALNNIPSLPQNPFAQPRNFPGDIASSIRKQNKGKANRLFVDSINVFIRLVKRENPKLNKMIRLLFRQIYNGRIEQKMARFFTNTYLFCFHKDKSDPIELWPIGVPTVLPQIMANHVTRTFCKRFA